MKRNKITCPDCGQEISKSNFSKHQRRHQNHPETFEIPKYKVIHEGLDCQFCGKTCKNNNSLRNHERLCKNNPDRQESSFHQYNNRPEHQAWNKGLNKETSEGVRKHSESLKKYYETHDGSWKGKKHTEDQKLKIGASVKKFLEANPEMVPYKRNHSSKESYPEMYFTDLFSAENIDLHKQFPVGSYRLDFADPDKKIAIEIDGEQHYVDKKMVAHDEIRDAYLKSIGWYVYRIRWSHFKSANIDKRKEIIEEIKKLLY